MSQNQLVEVERDEAVTELEEVRQQRNQLKADLTKETQSRTTQVSIHTPVFHFITSY